MTPEQIKVLDVPSGDTSFTTPWACAVKEDVIVPRNAHARKENGNTNATFSEFSVFEDKEQNGERRQHGNRFVSPSNIPPERKSHERKAAGTLFTATNR